MQFVRSFSLPEVRIVISRVWLIVNEPFDNKDLSPFSEKLFFILCQEIRGTHVLIYREQILREGW